MASKLEVLQELDRRGTLPDKYRPAFNEALKRGLVSFSEPPPGVKIHEQGRGIETPEQDRSNIIEQEAAQRADGLSGIQRAAPMLQGLGFEGGDELAGGIASPFTAFQSGNSLGDEFDINRRAVEMSNERAHEERPKEAFAGQLLGTLGTALSAPVVAPLKGVGFLPGLGNAAATGATYGGAAGVLGGSPGERLESGAKGVGIGAVLGPVAQGAVTGMGAALKPITSMFRPDKAAQKYLAGLLQKSGSSVDDVTDDMAAAIRDGQGSFTLGDALGHPGQRTMSTIARTPNDTRTKLVEMLEARQAEQSRRVSSQLSEAFEAPETALARKTALKADRADAADIAYKAAGESAGPVDVTKSVTKIDELLKVYDTGKISKALKTAKKSLGNGSKDSYEAVLAAKKDISDAAFKAAGTNKGRLLKQVLKGVDESLENASPAYRAANDDFAAASKVIEAVDDGSIAATRGRADDNIAAFQNLTPEGRSAYKAGFADPLLKKVEHAAPSSNVARQFVNSAAKQEFGAIAGSKGDRLNNQLAREMAMFDTRYAALGGTKTADNLADFAEMAASDPTVIGGILSGNPGGAAKALIAQSIARAQGLTPSVAGKVGEDLMMTGDDAVRQALMKGNSALVNSNAKRDMLVKALLGTAVNAGQRFD